MLIGTGVSTLAEGEEAEVVRRLITATVAVMTLATSGCVLPEHYTPGSYSSTCRQRLQESTIDWSQTSEGPTRQSFSLEAH